MIVGLSALVMQEYALALAEQLDSAIAMESWMAHLSLLYIVVSRRRI